MCVCVCVYVCVCMRVFVCVYVCMYIYSIPLHEQDVTQGQFFKWSLTGLNSEYFFS